MFWSQIMETTLTSALGRDFGGTGAVAGRKHYCNQPLANSPTVGAACSAGVLAGAGCTPDQGL